MDLENNQNKITAETNPIEETKEEEPQATSEIITEKEENKTDKHEKQNNEKLMEKLSEDPVKQKKILKDLTRKDVRFSYDLQKKLASIPRKVLNRRYTKLQEVIFDYLVLSSLAYRRRLRLFLRGISKTTRGQLY